MIMISTYYYYRHLSTCSLSRRFGYTSLRKLLYSKSAESRSSSIVIYERSHDRTFLPRSALAFTSFQTLYWIWYVFDFTPSVNHAASTAAAAAVTTSNSFEHVINQTMVDPKIGYLGLLVGSIVSVGAMIYPKYLVNQIRWDPQLNKIYIRTYQLPLVTTPAETSAFEFHKGSVYLENNGDISTILNEHGGDLTQYRGHLGLKAINWRGNFLLQLAENSKDEVKDVDLFLQLLLRDTKAMIAVGGAGYPKSSSSSSSSSKKPPTTLQSIPTRKRRSKK